MGEERWALHGGGSRNGIVGVSGWARWTRTDKDWYGRSGGNGGTVGQNYLRYLDMFRCMRGSTEVNRGVRQEVVRPIRFGVYNICNCWNKILVSALSVMSQENMDLGVFQETMSQKGSTRGSLVGTSWWRQRLRARTAALLPCSTKWCSIPPWGRYGYLSAGVGRTAVFYCGVLLGTILCLDNRGRRRDHQPAALGGRATGGQKF